MTECQIDAKRALLFLVQLLSSSSFHVIQSNHLNTTSGVFQGQQKIVDDLPIRQFFAIPYGEKPRRFQRAVLRRRHNETIQLATQRTAACFQASIGLWHGPVHLDEDCLTLNLFLPDTNSTKSKAILVFAHGGLNQVGSASLFDGSVLAARGDVIVITINYRLNLFGYLTPDVTVLSGNYGLYDQLLALEWISINANNFHGDSQRITYVGHSTGAVNALLLAMSQQSTSLIRRVIAQSGNPLNSWTIDRNPSARFNRVLQRNGMKTNNKFQRSNIDRLKTMPATDFSYMNEPDLTLFPDDPYPVVDHQLVTENLEKAIRQGPLTNIDILIGTTTDELVPFTSRSQSPQKEPLGKKLQHIKSFFQENYPNYVCFYNEMENKYQLKRSEQQNLTDLSHFYRNLVNDLMFYYDLVRFLHERLQSQPSASTYVYYYNYPTDKISEIDLLWGRASPNSSTTSELRDQLIRYWTNFVKTGNPNTPEPVRLVWPAYESEYKAYLNLDLDRTSPKTNFLEDRFQSWDMLLHRPPCTPFHWYQTCLLVIILILVLLLILIYVFYNTKRSRRNIKPMGLTPSEMMRQYHYLPSADS